MDCLYACVCCSGVGALRLDCLFEFGGFCFDLVLLWWLLFWVFVGSSAIFVLGFNCCFVFDGFVGFGFGWFAFVFLVWAV